MPLSQAARPHVRPTVETLVDSQVDALDGLMAELRLGIRNQRHFDELEARGDAISRGIRSAFRDGAR